MEKWREEYKAYMNRYIADMTPIRNTSSCVHHCPSCGEYLWADKYHKSYNHCLYCGRNLKGKKLPYDRI